MHPTDDPGVRDQGYEALNTAALSGREGVAQRVALTSLLYRRPECRQRMWQRPSEERFAVFSPEQDSASD